jgi:cell division protein FtsW (lipid II flippase)
MVLPLSAFSLLAAHAAPIPPAGSTSPQSPKSGWSKEAIFTLVGVVIAIIGIFITVMKTSQTAGNWFNGVSSGSALLGQSEPTC